MLSAPPRRRPWRAFAFPALGLALGLTLGACADEPTLPFAPEEPRDDRPTAQPLGLVEITISGLSDGSTSGLSGSPTLAVNGSTLAKAGSGPDMALSASAVAASPGTLPVHTDASGDGTIQLEPLSVGSFTVGTRGDGGYRYVSATYRVRNAQTDGTAYDTPRQNLTFYAVGTSGTLGQTPISRLARFDGNTAAIDPATILPTGVVRLDAMTGEVRPAGADVLQVISEAEAADLLALTGPTTETVFPWGFVVRNPNAPSSRTLPANPAADQFDGLVTFAFKIPLASSPADDPFTVSAVFLALDEDDVVVTQSLEEQTPEGTAAFLARAEALGASRVTLLPQAIYTGSIAPRILCSVRVAGPAGSPERTLTPAPATGAWFLSPAPVVLPRTTAITVGHCGSGGTAPSASNFVVHGAQSGKRFLGQDGLFTRDGALLASPTGTFFPGEEIDLTLTTALGSSEPFVTRLRVATAPATATFTLGSEIRAPSSRTPETIAIGDLDGDGHLDIVMALQPESRDVVVLYGQGDGGFSAPTHYPVGEHVGSATIGDVNGDGILDIVTGPPINLHTNSGRVLLGDGARGFSVASSYSLPYSTPQLVALGDVNGDGHLDIVTAEFYNTIGVVLGNGTGSFSQGTTYPTDGWPQQMKLGDVTGDGRLDVVSASRNYSEVWVSRGDGGGGFELPESYDPGVRPSGIALGDLNGDGVLDIVISGMSMFDGVSVLLSDGRGGFQAPVRFFQDIAYLSAIALGDVNGDGHLDLIGSHKSVYVALGDGNGGFDTSSLYTYPMHQGDGLGIVLGDVDGDGKLDIVVNFLIDRTLKVLLNN